MYAFVTPFDGMQLTDSLAYRRSELLGARHSDGGSMGRYGNVFVCGRGRHAEDMDVPHDTSLGFRAKNSSPTPYDLKTTATEMDYWSEGRKRPRQVSNRRRGFTWVRT